MVALGALGGVAWASRQFLLNDPRFFLSSVELRGGQYAARSQVEDQFVSDRGRSLLRVPLDERRRAVEAISWVRAAAVTRVFPNRITVAIEERVPVAFVWTSDGIALLDAEGVILEMPPQASFTFPVVRGVSERDPPAERRAKMHLFVAMRNDLDRGEARLSDQISEVDLSDPQDARVVVADSAGAVLLHLGNEDFLSRYLLYASQVGQWKQKFANVRSVDLRFDGQVVINADPAMTLPGAGGAIPEAAHPSGSSE
jgi:cell division protein FtsQ